MSGQIFISYRREESGWSARSLHDRLAASFDPKQIFMDVDAIALGEDFVKEIERTVAKCDVLIAVIGNNWLTSKDDQGDRRLDNPGDFVRMEIATALSRDIRVIPVLVDGALMPHSTELPDDLKPLSSRNALRISVTTFGGDCQRLVATIRQVLEKAATEEQEREKNRLDAERWQREETQLREAGDAESSVRPPTPTPSLDSSDPAFFDNRGWDFYQKNEYDKAISDYNEAIRLDPNYASAYNNRGFAYYFYKKDYDKAISDYNEAIRLNPNLAIAYNNRGAYHSRKKDYDTAISNYSDAIRLNPNLAIAYYNRAAVYYSYKKDYDTAISNYSEVIRLNPNDAVAYNNRGLAYYDKKEYDKAISDYDEAIRLNPNLAHAYYNRAVAYRKQGKRAQARTDFDKAKKLGYSPQ